MRQLLFLITLIVLYSLTLSAEDHPITFEKLRLKKTIMEKLENGDVYTKSDVNSWSEGKKKLQKFDFIQAGLHPRDCKTASNKLSRYENFSEYVDNVKTSSYNEDTHDLHFLITSALLPRDFILDFKIDRVKGEGIYRFIFEKGILANLKGEIHMSNYGKRCFIHVLANWQGPDSGFYDTILEIFSETVMQAGLEKLIRLSR